MAPRYLNVRIARDGWINSRLDGPGKEYIEEKDERATEPVWVALERQNLMLSPGDEPDSSVKQIVIS